jgi:predicted peptidase
LLFGLTLPTTTTTIIAKIATFILVDHNSPFCYNIGIVINKEPKMTEFEKNCYGMSAQDIREQYMQSITARLSGLEMVAMGVLSDAQELMTFGNKQATDQARKNINIAKFILSEMMDKRESEEMVLVSSDGKEIA